MECRNIFLFEILAFYKLLSSCSVWSRTWRMPRFSSLAVDRFSAIKSGSKHKQINYVSKWIICGGLNNSVWLKFRADISERHTCLYLRKPPNLPSYKVVSKKKKKKKLNMVHCGKNGNNRRQEKREIKSLLTSNWVQKKEEGKQRKSKEERKK